MGAKHFEAGDRVAHSARVAYQHGTKSIARWDGVQGLDPDAFLGTIVGPANAVETVWTVKPDAGEQREFTADSLVKIEE